MPIIIFFVNKSGMTSLNFHCHANWLSLVLKSSFPYFKISLVVNHMPVFPAIASPSLHAVQACTKLCVSSMWHNFPSDTPESHTGATRWKTVFHPSRQSLDKTSVIENGSIRRSYIQKKMSIRYAVHLQNPSNFGCVPEYHIRHYGWLDMASEWLSIIM